MNDYLLVAAGVLAGPVIGGVVSGANGITTARITPHLEALESVKKTRVVAAPLTSI
jgi:hypothetical protein